MITAATLRQVEREECYRAFTPPERLTVSQWADRYRYLSPESAAIAERGPVRWSTELVPYLREVMDDLGRADVREVVFAKSAQVGGSSAGENWLGWITDHRPGPTLIVWPSEKKFHQFSKLRLDPMIRDTPRLAEKFPKSGRRNPDDTIALKQFRGGYLQNLTAKSTADLRSFSARNVDCEEIDEWESDLKEQGDPVDLVQARVIAFGESYKLFYVSTPRLAGYSKIWRLLEASSDARYHVECPHCNAGQAFEWRNAEGALRFVWESDAAGAPIGESVRYQCAHCTQLIDFAWRDRMVSAGRWVHQHPDRRFRRGYHIWSAYSRFVTWARIVQLHVDAREDPLKTKAFINLWLGIPYKSEGQTKALDPHYLKSRAVTFPVTDDGELVVPSDVGLLTAFCDVQVDRLEFFLEGWGADRRNWKVEWITLDGDPSQPEVWEQLATLLRQPWPHESGHTLRIAAMAIDANYQKRAVHDFVEAERHVGVFPTIGKGGRGRQLLSEPGKPRSKKARSQWKPVWVIGTDTAKDQVDGMLRRKLGEPGYVTFSDALDEAYWDGLTSEQLTIDYVKGRPMEVWRPIDRRRNEPLDAAVGNLAALERLGPQVIGRLGELAKDLATREPGTVATPKPPPGRRVRSRGHDV